MMAHNTKAIHIDQYGTAPLNRCFLKRYWNQIGTGGLFALSCDGKLGLDQTASWLLWSSNTPNAILAQTVLFEKSLQ